MALLLTRHLRHFRSFASMRAIMDTLINCGPLWATFDISAGPLLDGGFEKLDPKSEEEVFVSQLLAQSPHMMIE